MAKRLDRIVVVDVESTCWNGDPPAGQESEIIEIGVCTVDVASGEQVERGVSFAEACALLKRKSMSKDRAWAGWGDYDRRQFERQCRAFGVGYPFGPTHINVKALFAIIHALPYEVGMDAALGHLGLPLEGTHHRGVDDAWNIGRILSTILLQRRTGAATAPPRPVSGDS